MPEIEVLIMSQSYRLASEAGREEDLRQAVARVDKEMCAIRDAGRLKARERIAVLAALNLAFDLTRAQQAQAARKSETALPLHEALPNAPSGSLGPIEQMAARERMSQAQSNGRATISHSLPSLPTKGAIPVLSRAIHVATENAERKAADADGEESLEALIERIDMALGTQKGLFDAR